MTFIKVGQHFLSVYNLSILRRLHYKYFKLRNLVTIIILITPNFAVSNFFFSKIIYFMSIVQVGTYSKHTVPLKNQNIDGR